MRAIASRRIALAWLLLTTIFLGATLLLWRILWLDGAPRNAVVISLHSDGTPTAALGGAETTAILGDPAIKATATPAALTVYVSGNVALPGVYTLPGGSRLDDAIRAAGGLTADADPDAINLAEKLSDGEHIRAPGKTDRPAAQATSQAEPTSRPTPTGSTGTEKTYTPTPQSVPGAKVDINTATAEELETLPGIGPVLAQRIVDYRQASGPFRSVEELDNVPGIGAALMAKLRNLITVGP